MMDLVPDLSIDSLRILEKVFILSLMLTLNQSIIRGLRTLFIGIQATHSYWKISYLDGIGFGSVHRGTSLLDSMGPVSEDPYYQRPSRRLWRLLWSRASEGLEQGSCSASSCSETYDP